MIPETDSFLKMPSDRGGDLLEYMWIGVSEKFLVSTATTSVEPFRVAAIPVHFEVSGPELVKVKRAGSDQWMTHGVRREEGTLWWTIRGRDVPWTFVSPDAVPQWANDIFARGRAKLRKEKESEQIVDDNPS